MRPLALIALLLSACTPNAAAPIEQKTPLRINGSESLTQSLLPALAKSYVQSHPTVHFFIGKGSTHEGIQKLLDGQTDIAAVSRRPTPAEEEQAQVYGYSLISESAQHLIAVDVVALSVHPSNPINSLEYDQIIDIFCTGEVKNWSAFGLDDRPITPIVPPKGSGTRFLFEDFFCGPKGLYPRLTTGSLDEANAALTSDPGAISFSSLAETRGKPIGLRPEPNAHPIHPSINDLASGAYPLSRDLYLVTRGRALPPASTFLSWVHSKPGQAVVDASPFTPLFLRPDRHNNPRPLRDTIHFKADKTEPNTRSMKQIAHLISELRERSGQTKHISIEGFADSREANPIALSTARAEAVRDLLAADLPGLTFEIIPRGSTRPHAPNSTVYGRDRNRRVQIYLEDDQQSVIVKPQ